MRHLRSFAIALATISVAACSDSTGPGVGGTTPLTIDLCDAGVFPAAWFAYQNQGGAWTQVTPNAQGKITFDATDKVSIAMALSFFGTSFTQVINASAAELQAPAGACLDSFGNRSMSGTVAGISGEQFVRISAGEVSNFADASNPAWSLEDLPARPLDIVATRYPTPFSQPANRVVVRRGVTPNNAAIAALDFGSATESAALESQTATFTNAANSTLYVSSQVITANGTAHQLGELSGSAAGTGPQPFGYVAIPSPLRVSTDLHVINATALSVDGTRTLDHYFQAPGAKTLAMGPMVGTPTVTTAAATPYVRPRAQLAVQAEYPSAMLMQWTESDGEESATIVSVFTTKGFSGGTPQTWDVTVPDMTSAGYNAAWGLQSSESHWSVSVFSGGDVPFIGGATPPSGTTILSATRDDGALVLNRGALTGRDLLRVPATLRAHHNAIRR